uniref:ID528 n=1 Tax=Bradyrhizobium japonicum TaxID=375 RepID=Q9AN54_BRAJP|nr:ID528 [Bradyrhizobium japonicum]
MRAAKTENNQGFGVSGDCDPGCSKATHTMGWPPKWRRTQDFLKLIALGDFNR